MPLFPASPIFHSSSSSKSPNSSFDTMSVTGRVFDKTPSANVQRDGIVSTLYPRHADGSLRDFHDPVDGAVALVTLGCGAVDGLLEHAPTARANTMVVILSFT